MNSASPTSHAQTIAREARRLVIPELMPEAAFVSLPIPVVRDGAPAAAFFAAVTVERADGTNEDMYAPVVEITLDWATGRQLDLRVMGTATPPPGEASVAAIRPLLFQSRLTPELTSKLDIQVNRLGTLLDAVVVRYGAVPQRPPMDDGTRYLEQFEDLVPAAVRPYYTALNPDFFEWVARGR